VQRTFGKCTTEKYGVNNKMHNRNYGNNYLYSFDRDDDEHKKDQNDK